MSERTWVLDEEPGRLVILRSMDGGHTGDSEGPTLCSREELEQFISALQSAASRVWP